MFEIITFPLKIPPLLCEKKQQQQSPSTIFQGKYSALKIQIRYIHTIQIRYIKETQKMHTYK